MPTIETMRATAEAAHAQYPQYAGHWDDWTVGMVTKRIRTKSGVAFEKGDQVMVSPDTRSERIPPRGLDKYRPYDEWPVKQFRTCYSFRNQIDTSVPADAVRVG